MLPDTLIGDDQNGFSVREPPIPMGCATYDLHKQQILNYGCARLSRKVVFEARRVEGEMNDWK